MGRHGKAGKGLNKRMGRAQGKRMRGKKRTKVGNKGRGLPKNKGRGSLPKNKGGGLPKRGIGKGWRQNLRIKGGKWRQGKGGVRQRNTITIQIQNPELYMEKLLEKFGLLETDIKERLTEFKVKIMGTEPGFCFILFGSQPFEDNCVRFFREGCQKCQVWKERKV